MYMKISADTRLSTILRHHRDAVQAIAGISEHFKKLHNPILRKLMAPRVNLAQAVKIGGCSLKDFQQALEPLGFEFETTIDTPDKTEKEMIPDWFKQIDRNQIVSYDVRAELTRGDDPLSNILLKLDELPAGQSLCIINSFKPEPLIALIEKNKRGKCYTAEVNPFEFHTYIQKLHTPNQVANRHHPYEMVSEDQFELVLKSIPANKLKTLDVRHLEMPLPMQQIMAAVQSQKKDESLHVLHQRVPVHLLEALDSLPLSIQILQRSDSDVQLIIQHT